MKKITTIILLFSAIYCSAYNLPTIDYKKYHFGFSLGINVLDFGLDQSMKIAPDGNLYQGEVSTLMPGFNIGLIGDLRLNNYFNLRFTPTLMLGERTINFMNNNTNDTFKSTVKSTIITFPVYLKYSAVRIQNYKPYLLLGGGYAIDLAHEQQQAILLNYHDFFVDFGIGTTFYLEYFRLSPEIKFAFGLNDLLTPWDKRTGFKEPDYQKYNNALSKITSQFFTLTFHFE